MPQPTDRVLDLLTALRQDVAGLRGELATVAGGLSLRLDRIAADLAEIRMRQEQYDASPAD